MPLRFLGKLSTPQKPDNMQTITMVGGDGETSLSRVEEEQSKFSGKTVAPVMTMFEIKMPLWFLGTPLSGGEGEANLGKVKDQQSNFSGKTVAPVMINFQVKCALAGIWRELRRDALEQLSSLYQPVYSGDKLKKWSTIFMPVAIQLAVWELIQVDCTYRSQISLPATTSAPR
jgi:hypothetical protein